MVRRQLPRFTYSFAALLHVVTFCWVCYSEAEAWAPPSAGSAQDSLGSLPKEDSRPSSLQGEESRKGFLLKGLSSSFVVLLTSTDKAAAAETVGKDPDCDDITCLGVWDGLLADCPHNNVNLGGFIPGIPGGGAGCMASQDDTPGIFSEPWDYSESPINNALEYSDQMRLLRPTVERVAARRGDNCQILVENDRYLRVMITDGKSSEKSVADFFLRQMIPQCSSVSAV